MKFEVRHGKYLRQKAVHYLIWVQIFWNNVPNGLRITDQRGFPREEHLLESHREHGFIIPKGYKPLAGGEAVGRHPRKAEENEPISWRMMRAPLS
jgi:hypothetical protein